ncbi:MAG: sulfurtransferase TusA family protein [Deltaproteobacteria bacterium]|nr:sulfurtransferase TusA family protein [Deltaproteobacteria bacterium]
MREVSSGVVDCRGSVCPGPLLEIKRAIQTIAVGEVLEVLSTDAATREDLPIWATKRGHEFLGWLSETGHDRLFVRRGK